MSLAITAASVENESGDNNYGFNNDTPIQRKRAALAPKNHNRTQKRFESEFNPEKVNSVLESIHSTIDVTGELADFNPRALANTLQKIIPLNPLNNSNSNSNSNSNVNDFKGKEGFEVPQPLENDSLDMQELNQAFLNDAQVRDYYKKLSPTFNSSTNGNGNANGNANGNGKNETNGTKVNASYSSNSGINSGINSGNDLLLTKLNYMINLLENQQDERTQNVTEEVVLYSFLGVFIIFVVDSFARVGKYIR
jgi:hypothetical protein